MDLLLAIVGLVLGFVLSVVLWWSLTHVIVPEVKFARQMSKRPRTAGRVVYRVKILNPSKRRGIIDLSFRARVVFKGHSFADPGARTTTIVDVPVDVDHIFNLPPRGDRILWLDFEGFSQDWSSILPMQLCEDLENGVDGSLEALLKLGPGGVFRVQALGYDQFSGARKFYQSLDYTASDIEFGRFSGLDVVSEARAPEGTSEGTPNVDPNTPP